MTKFDYTKRDSFGSKLGIISAAAGSAIGLGNIWRFPYVVGENGGAAFILLYVGFIVIIGIPVMLSELVIGRRAQRNAYGSFKFLKPGQPWYLIGLMGIGGAFMILAFYSTVAGWTLEYLYFSIINKFQGLEPSELQTIFNEFQVSGWRPVIWQVLIMALTAGIVISGVRKGIEKYTKILMPLMVILIIIMCIRSLTLPGAMEGLKFLFQPDFSKINADTVLEALGPGLF